MGLSAPACADVGPKVGGSKGKDGTLIARSNGSIRVLETASPPTFYLAPEAILEPLTMLEGSSFCEWKGRASYFAYQQCATAWRYDFPRSDLRVLMVGTRSVFVSRLLC